MDPDGHMNVGGELDSLNWYSAETRLQPLLEGHHDILLMLLSVLIAVLAACMALQVAGLARSTHSGWVRQFALITGSLALGGGIWSMHFLGMLAYDIGAPMKFSQALTLASVLPALLASWVCLTVLSREKVDQRQLILGGVIVGAGIGAMHYTGMLAIRTPAAMYFDPVWFALSVVVAMVMGWLALWIRFGLGCATNMRGSDAVLLGGIVMGLAISSMHYTGMEAVHFVNVPDGDSVEPVADSFNLAAAIALVTVGLVALVALVNAVIRWREMFHQMRNNEARLRAIVDTAVDAVITIDGRGRVQAFNPSAERIFGWRADEVLGRNIKMLMPEPDRRGHDGYLENYQRTGWATIIGKGREVTGLRRNGETFPMRLAIGETRVADGVLFVGFVTDLSEQKAIEASLHERELQYSSLIRNMPGVAFRCLPDRRWTTLFIGDAIERLSGWPAERFDSGQLALGDLIHPEDDGWVYETVMRALDAGESYAIEYRLVCRDGSERWVSETSSGVADDDGSVRWIDGVLVDITESRLRNAEFEGMVNAIDRAQALVEFRLDGTISRVNENFLALSGYSRDELIGRDGRIIGADRLAGSGKPFWSGLVKGRFVAGECCLKRQNGSDLWVQAHFNPIVDADGEPTRIIMLATDLSARLDMEMDLIAARDRAEQAAEAKGTFLANMSHEIRTPMNAILGFSEVLLKDALSDTQRRYASTVHEAARSLLKLLNDVLDTAKLERDALELDPARFSVRGLCEQLVEIFSLQAENKGLALRLDYRLPATHYVGDALRIRQILTNLLGNAIKFTERGQVQLIADESLGCVRFRVIDTGIGIAPERIERIFEPFSQADASMGRRFGGTGLGTTIARQLAELMGGGIQVSSRVGEGSCFTASLPLRQARAETARQPSTMVSDSTPALTILAADDVPSNLELLKLMFEQRGHTVDVAEDGQQAYRMYCRHDYDVVLMDVHMPGMDGLETTRMIRDHEISSDRARVPVIALTASVFGDDREAARAAGMDGFATKPVDIAALLSEMGRLLELDVADNLDVDGNAGLGPGAVEDGPLDLEDALRRWPNRAALVRALVPFLQHAADVAAQWQTLLPQVQIEYQEIHRLRGAAANLSLVGIQSALDALGRLLSDVRADAKSWRLALLALAREIERASVQCDVLALEDTAVTKPAPTGSNESSLPDLAAAVAASLRRGEIDGPGLERLAAAVGTARFVSVQAAVDEFDLELAARRIEAFVSDPAVDVARRTETG